MNGGGKTHKEKDVTLLLAGKEFSPSQTVEGPADFLLPSTIEGMMMTSWDAIKAAMQADAKQKLATKFEPDCEYVSE